MSRSRRDILDTESMLDRLEDVLQKACTGDSGDCRTDAESLRRISMTLHRWHELECGTDAGAIVREEKWAIERAAWPIADRVRWWTGSKWDRKPYRCTYDDFGKKSAVVPADGAWRKTGEKTYWRNGDGRLSPTPDREKGALARLAKVMARYPSLASYVQTDPRGCALYILRPGDVPAGERPESYYTRGIAVHA